VDYTRNYGEVSGSVAVAKGYGQSALWIPQGLEQVTTAVFEIPSAVESLALVVPPAAESLALVCQKAVIKLS